MHAAENSSLDAALDCVLDFYKVKDVRGGQEERPGAKAAARGGVDDEEAPCDRTPSRTARPTLEEQLETHFEGTGLAFRRVRLEGRWWKRCSGCLLGTVKGGAPVALVPCRGGYAFTDPRSGKRVHVDEDAMRETVNEKAYCFYRLLPARPFGLRDLITHVASSLRPVEYVKALVSALVVAIVGACVPYLNFVIYHIVLPGDDRLGSDIMRVVVAIGMAVAAAAVSRALFEANVQLVKARAASMVKTDLCAAFMMRILSLPTSFFRAHPAGSLASRFAGLEPAVDAFLSLACETSLAGVFLVVYVVQLGVLSPGMLWACVLVVVATLAANIAAARCSARRQNRILEMRARTGQIEFSTLSAIRKLRSAGAEKRAYARWAQPYAQATKLSYVKPGPLVWAPVLTTALTVAGLVALYACAAAGGVEDASDYMVFASSYALIQGCMSSVVASLARVFEMKPYLEMLAPIMRAVPESAERGSAASCSEEGGKRGDNTGASNGCGGGANDKRGDSTDAPEENKADRSEEAVEQAREVLRDPRGHIEMRHVSFAYENGAQVFEDLSLSVEPGEFVGVVGKSGCGKSTLLRLLLGFERPDAGSVCFDGHDLATLDCERLRRDAFGVVLQDSRLFEGTVFDNVGVASTALTREEAWEALEVADLAQDVRKMAMGIDTFVGPGGCNLSGGQRQRVLLARAVAAKPKLLLLDEATSALDNVTQKRVADALSHIGCTRIVVAHRLSTVRGCDRILVLDGGRVVEQGGYDELSCRGKAFAELMRHQEL